MEFAWDDGGRREAYPDWPADAGDCVSRGISIYTGIPYTEVSEILGRANTNYKARKGIVRRKYKLALAAGREADGGIAPDVSRPFMVNRGLHCVWEAGHGEHGLTSDEAFRMFGDCILCSKGANGCHMVAIKGGKLRDTWDGTRGEWSIGRNGRYERKVRYCEVWVRKDLIPEGQISYHRPKVIREVTGYEDRPVPSDVAEKLETRELRDAANRKLVNAEKVKGLKAEAARLLARCG